VRKAFDQFGELSIILQSLSLNGDKDTWSYIWGNAQYSSRKAYKHLFGFSGSASNFWLDLNVFLSNVSCLEPPTSKIKITQFISMAYLLRHNDLYRFRPLERNTLRLLFECMSFIESWELKYEVCTGWLITSLGCYECVHHPPIPWCGSSFIAQQGRVSQPISSLIILG
jgi:hypothetical protein